MAELVCAGCGERAYEVKGALWTVHKDAQNGDHAPWGHCTDCGRRTNCTALGVWLCRGHTITAA